MSRRILADASKQPQWALPMMGRTLPFLDSPYKGEEGRLLWKEGLGLAEKPVEGDPDPDGETPRRGS